jgi:DNA-binding GntR family transcriptional regulator
MCQCNFDLVYFKYMEISDSGKLTQTEKAYGALKKAILRGDIEEGVFLSESDIMRRYEIGRTPYREACNRLHHERLLEAVPRRGYLVPEVSYQAVCAIFETRLILESAIAELACARATEKDLVDLDRLAGKPQRSGNPERDFAKLIQANTDFHIRLAKTTRNRELVELLTRTLEKTERLMYIELRCSRFWDAEFEGLHRRIVDALRSRDPRQAREALLSDITDAQKATLSFGQNPLGLEINGIARRPQPDQSKAPLQIEGQPARGPHRSTRRDSSTE